MKREVLDTGIVKRVEYIPDDKSVDALFRATIATINEEYKIVRKPIRETLSEIERVVSEFVSRCEPTDEQIATFEITEDYELAFPEASPQSIDAYIAQIHLNQLRNAIAEGDLEDSVRVAIFLGRLIERIEHVRPVEPQVKKHKDGSNKGKTISTGGGDLSRAETVRAYQEAVSKNPRAKFSKIVQMVVECRQKLDHEKTRPVERSIRRHLREAKDPITGEKTPITPESHDSALE